MRRERGGRIFPLAAILAVSLHTSLINITPLAAQTPSSVIQDIVEQMAEDGVADERLAEYYGDLALRRPDINTLSRQELERTHLLSIFQIESLFEHRKRYGDILSAGELSLVDGFSAASVERLKLFFSFPDSPLTTYAQRSGWTNELNFRAVKPFGGNGVSLAGKYKCEAPRHWAFGLAADSDAGEGLSQYGHPDFVSAFALWKGSGFVRQAVAGDYSVRAGQGLVVWKSFSMNAFGPPSSVMKRPSGISPYSSLSESGFFRGGAVELNAAGCDVSVFASYNAVDARILEDGSYSSISTDGYHRTASEIARRRSMHETVLGLTATREFGNWRFGVTGVAYTYDRDNGRTVREYNRYQQYDGWWGNFGADFFYTGGPLRIFGEVAFDAGGGAAALLGAVWSPVYELEFSAHLRHYGKDYIATHAGAYSTLSSCSNQDGIVLAARWYVTKRWSITANAGFTYHPWSRYGVSGPSGALKSRITANWKPSERLSADFRLRYDYAKERSAVLGDARATFSLTPHISFEGRVAANTGGVAAYAGVKLSFLRGKLELSGRFTGYCTDGYDNRIYFYEGNVPRTFSCRALYGRGTGEYLVVKYSPVRWLTLYLRASESSASYFMRIFIPG